jgi:hypothetical protein
MKSTTSIGLFPIYGDGQPNKSATRFSTASTMQTSFQFNHAPNCNVVSLPLYRAQRRRAQALAAQDARRRCLNSSLAILMIISGFITVQYTIHREHHLQQIERW